MQKVKTDTLTKGCRQVESALLGELSKPSNLHVQQPMKPDIRLADSYVTRWPLAWRPQASFRGKWQPNRELPPGLRLAIPSSLRIPPPSPAQPTAECADSCTRRCSFFGEFPMAHPRPVPGASWRPRSQRPGPAFALRLPGGSPARRFRPNTGTRMKWT